MTAAGIILPGLVVPVKAALAEQTEQSPTDAEPSTAQSLAKAAAAAPLIQSARDAKFDAAAALNSGKPKPEKGEKDAQTDADDSADKATTITATLFVMPLPVPVEPVAAASVRTSSPLASARAPTLPPATPAVAKPGAEQAQPANGTAASTATAALTADVLMPQATASLDPKPAVAVEIGTSRQAAALPTKPQAASQVPGSAPIQADQHFARPQAAAEATAAAAPKPETAAKVADAQDRAAPLAADPQPLTPMTDLQPAVQTADPTIAPQPAINHQNGHDFATLVDRLVEAREAAMPQAVHAAVSHDEFGKVSLRFDQDARGLSVSMSSADPDFARAVQAGASSAQSQTASDNGASPQRQDTSPQQQQQQQTFGSSSGQPQSQSQASARNDRGTGAQNETRTGGSAGQTSQDEDAADARGGIYA
jgi:hypothetical protein